MIRTDTATTGLVYIPPSLVPITYSKKPLRAVGGLSGQGCLGRLGGLGGLKCESPCRAMIFKPAKAQTKAQRLGGLKCKSRCRAMILEPAKAQAMARTKPQTKPNLEFRVYIVIV